MPHLSCLPALKLLIGHAAGCLAAFLLPGFVLPVGAFIALAGACAAIALRSLTPLYWAALVLIGLWTADAARGLSLRVESTAGSEIPAVVRGRIERVVGSDSISVRCILRGTVDTRPMKPHNNTGIALTVVRPDSVVRRFMQPGNDIAACARVRLPRPATLPGEFDEQVFYASVGVEWVGAVSTRSIALAGRHTSIDALVQKAGEGVAAELCRLFPERTEGMAIALVTGDRSRLGRETKDEFTTTGTAHVLAVSGLHVGILAAIILLPLARLRRSGLRLVLFAAALFAYTLLTGMQPSMLRAAIMAVLILITADAQRQSNLLNILCFTVVVMTVFDPNLLFSMGFHLSVLSLAGIALLYPAVDAALGLFLKSERSAVRFTRSSLAVTLAASATVSPLVAWSFSVFSIVSPLANLFVIPLTSLGMIYALCALSAAQIADWCSVPFVHTADALLYFAQLLNSQVAALPAAAIKGEYSLVPALCSSACTVYVVCAKKRRSVLFRTAVATIATAALCALFYSAEQCAEVVSRTQIVAVVVPVNAGRSLVLLQDRRPDMYPKRDPGLENYLDARTDTTTIIACGPASLRCAASLRRTTIDAVIAQTLKFKNRGLWAALDSLDARGVRVLNAECMLSEKRVVLLRGGRTSLRWDAWKNSVSLHTLVGAHEIVLPRVVHGWKAGLPKE